MVRALVTGAALAAAAMVPLHAQGPSTTRTSSRPASASFPAPSASPDRTVFDKYCVTCHNQRFETADLALDGVGPADPPAHPDVWEQVIRKVRVGMVPPQSAPPMPPEDHLLNLTALQSTGASCR